MRLPYRHIIAITALISGMVALYLHLWKLGLAGALACGGGHGCALVQFSSWSWFLGVDVALIGAVGYSLIFLVAMWGIVTGRDNDPKITIALMLLIYPAFLFTLRLKYAEFIILKTFCPWCAISAVTITLQTILVTLDWRRTASREQRTANGVAGTV